MFYKTITITPMENTPMTARMNVNVKISVWGQQSLSVVSLLSGSISWDIIGLVIF